AFERDEILFYWQGWSGSSSGPVFPYEHTDEYRAQRKDPRKWEHKRWLDAQKPYWEKYHAEFRADIEIWEIGKPFIEQVPLDEELELNPPKPKSEPYDARMRHDIGYDVGDY